jgi:hypothetical protein
MATKLTFTDRELLERFRKAYRDEIGPADEIYTEAAREPVQMPGDYFATSVQASWACHCPYFPGNLK